MKPKTPATSRSENSITIYAISAEQIGLLNVRPISAGRGGSQKPQHKNPTKGRFGLGSTTFELVK
jgi:hypothetical protein